MYRRNFTNCFSGNRKVLYIILCIVLVSVFSLTIVYAALNTVLKITGNADVLSASWDIYLDNIDVSSGSVSGSAPTIVDPTTVSFTTKLTNPGDYYMFTVDVVNNGSIDAMIDSVVKSPTLTDIQSKYLNYIVEYQNGESINTNQLVKSNSFVRFKVKIEFRKDIVASDLPKNTEILNLSFKVNYVQASENGTSSIPNNGKLLKVVNGNYDTVGSEICIGDECFYVVSSDTNSVTMLSKYNLHVGNRFDDTDYEVALENPTGIQDESAIGWFEEYSVDNPIIGVKPFSKTNYWESTISQYPAYVYSEDSYLYEYVENYKNYLGGLGMIINEARLIKMEELESLGCSMHNYSCSEAPSWVYSTTYWTGIAFSNTDVFSVRRTLAFAGNNCVNKRTGVRPVVVISKDNF